MKRFINILILTFIGFINAGQTQNELPKGQLMEKVVRTDAEWQTCLTP